LPYDFVAAWRQRNRAVFLMDECAGSFNEEETSAVRFLEEHRRGDGVILGDEFVRVARRFAMRENHARAFAEILAGGCPRSHPSHEHIPLSNTMLFHRTCLLFPTLQTWTAGTPEPSLACSPIAKTDLLRRSSSRPRRHTRAVLETPARSLKRGSRTFLLDLPRSKRHVV
jgi:hypothetical protein